MRHWMVIVEKAELDEVEAWHASPHYFDAFSCDFIGVGEGNQSFGWGLYFASNAKTAETYSDLRSLVDKDGNPVQINADPESDENIAFRYYVAANGNGHLVADKASQDYSDDDDDEFLNDGEEAPDAGIQRAIADLYYRGVQITPRRRSIYQVSLPEGDYLLWDQPFENQTPTVQQAIQDGLHDSQLARCDGVPGMRLYSRLVKHLGSQKTASLWLAKHGVIGNKYLDGDSRTSGDGSYNYVVFDDSVIKIIASPKAP